MSVFFLIMCLLACFLYFFGTRQEFADETQFLLLKLAAITGSLLLISSVYGFILNLVFFVILKQPRYLGGFLLFVLFGFAGGIIAAGAYTILFLTDGRLVA